MPARRVVKWMVGLKSITIGDLVTSVRVSKRPFQKSVLKAHADSYEGPIVPRKVLSTFPGATEKAFCSLLQITTSELKLKMSVSFQE